MILYYLLRTHFSLWYDGTMIQRYNTMLLLSEWQSNCSNGRDTDNSKYIVFWYALCIYYM